MVFFSLRRRSASASSRRPAWMILLFALQLFCDEASAAYTADTECCFPPLRHLLQREQKFGNDLSQTLPSTKVIGRRTSYNIASQQDQRQPETPQEDVGPVAASLNSRASSLSWMRFKSRNRAPVLQVLPMSDATPIVSFQQGVVFGSDDWRRWTVYQLQAKVEQILKRTKKIFYPNNLRIRLVTTGASIGRGIRHFDGIGSCLKKCSIAKQGEEEPPDRCRVLDRSDFRRTLGQQLLGNKGPRGILMYQNRGNIDETPVIPVTAVIISEGRDMPFAELLLARGQQEDFRSGIPTTFDVISPRELSQHASLFPVEFRHSLAFLRRFIQELPQVKGHTATTGVKAGCSTVATLAEQLEFAFVEGRKVRKQAFLTRKPRPRFSCCVSEVLQQPVVRPRLAHFLGLVEKALARPVAKSKQAVQVIDEQTVEWATYVGGGDHEIGNYGKNKPFGTRRKSVKEPVFRDTRRVHFADTTQKRDAVEVSWRKVQLLRGHDIWTVAKCTGGRPHAARRTIARPACEGIHRSVGGEAMWEQERGPDFIKQVRPMASGTPSIPAHFFVNRP
ncbi:unnamed protein product, partial [Amoebophrya sp. A120]|eukprot:GSA120T00010638001.1